MNCSSATLSVAESTSTLTVEAAGSTLLCIKVIRDGIFMVGSLDGVGSIVGALELEKILSGALAGVGGTSAQLSLIKSLAGSMNGAGGISGDITVGIGSLAGDLNGAGTIEAGLTITKILSASLAGVGSIGADLSLTKILTGTLDGIGGITGDVTVGFGSLDGSLDGVGSITGDLSNTIHMDGDLDGVGGTSAGLSITVHFDGTLAGVGSITGDLTVSSIIASNLLLGDGTSNLLLGDGASVLTLGNTNDFLTSLSAYWKLDESSGTRSDSQASFDLTDNNTVTSRTGVINDGAEFDDANSEYLNVSHSTSLEPESGDFSVSTWFYLDDFASSHTVLSKGNTSSFDPGFIVLASQPIQKIYFRCSDSTGLVRAGLSTPTLSVSTLYHLVFTVDRTNDIIKGYLNGSATGFVAGGGGSTSDDLSAFGSITEPGEDFIIGSRASLSLFMDGMIDETAIYKGRVLTQSEATTLYNGGSGVSFDDFE